MISTTFKILILSLYVCFIGSVLADVPNVPTEAPYIVLDDNLDEPNGYGFCLDTMGAGQSELMHVHSCKPKTPKDSPRNHRSHDVRFKYDSVTKQIRSYAYEGQCVQVILPKGSSEFGLLDCSEHTHQKFIYNQTEKTFRLESNPDECVAVDSKTVKAGPWVKRTLKLAKCNQTELALKQWLIVSR